LFIGGKMCDCYQAPCEVCGKPLPIHIADFCTDRENVKVWCHEDIDKSNAGSTIHWYGEEDNQISMAILVLDKDAYGIYPNA